MTFPTITLGKRYRDTLHGIEGIAVSHIRYFTGCDQISLERVQAGEIKSNWVDITRLEGVEVAAADQKPGGPQPTPPARHP